MNLNTAVFMVLLLMAFVALVGFLIKPSITYTMPAPCYLATGLANDPCNTTLKGIKK